MRQSIGSSISLTHDKYLKIVDSLLIDVHQDYRKEIMNLIEDLRHVFGQPNSTLMIQESNQLLQDLDLDISHAKDTGDIMCALFARYLLLGDRGASAQMFALITDYSMKDNGCGYQNVLGKLSSFLHSE